MALQVQTQKVNSPSQREQKGKTTREKVKNTFTDELVIGICYPIGSRKDEVIEAIRNRMNDYGYESEIIKLSSFIEKYTIEERKEYPGKTKSYSELLFKIKGGNEIRKRYKSNSILADIAIWEINLDRTKSFQKDSSSLPSDEDIKSRRKCYIIDSLKNIEELNLLRSVYRNMFYLFSIFSTEDERISNLLGKNLSIDEIEDLVGIDEYENLDHGQNVRDTFVEGDFFLRVTGKNITPLEERINRFLHLIFGSEIITPSHAERAMYAAKSAAGNSACLSRQVGAAITDSNGDVIATGWNDTPKFGGNLYSNEDINDQRCCKLGFCSNDNYKDNLVDEIANEILKEENFGKIILPKKEASLEIKEINRRKNLLKSNIRNTNLKGLIEFSRSIHAEMHAIIIGSQLSGNRMVDGKLYCTTYPCHNCARHIIVAGIKEVYFIEPYKKSLGTKLHEDAITEDERDLKKVRIMVFDGVAPRRYLEFFSMISRDERKVNGKRKSEKLSDYSPKNPLSLQSLPTLEKQAIHFLMEIGLIEE